MTRRCTVCPLPDRHEIDKALIRGVSLRRLAAQAGTSHMAMWRHKRECIPRMLAPYFWDYFRL